MEVQFNEMMEFYIEIEKVCKFHKYYCSCSYSSVLRLLDHKLDRRKPLEIIKNFFSTVLARAQACRENQEEE